VYDRAVNFGAFRHLDLYFPFQVLVSAEASFLESQVVSSLFVALTQNGKTLSLISKVFSCLEKVANF
jgi:hypothetical protein